MTLVYLVILLWVCDPYPSSSPSSELHPFLCFPRFLSIHDFTGGLRGWRSSILEQYSHVLSSANTTTSLLNINHDFIILATKTYALRLSRSMRLWRRWVSDLFNFFDRWIFIDWILGQRIQVRMSCCLWPSNKSIATYTTNRSLRTILYFWMWCKFGKSESWFRQRKSEDYRKFLTSLPLLHPYKTKAHSHNTSMSLVQCSPSYSAFRSQTHFPKLPTISTSKVPLTWVTASSLLRYTLNIPINDLLWSCTWSTEPFYRPSNKYFVRFQRFNVRNKLFTLLNRIVTFWWR